MGKEYIIQEETLTSIADAIRTLTSKSDKLLAENFDNEILAFYEEYQAFKQEYEAFYAQYETDKTNLEDIVYGNVSTTLAENSWETISMVSRAGRASEFWSIGDTITINFCEISRDVRIIGFDHDDVTDASAYGRTKAGITFEMVNFHGDPYPMNFTNTNVGGWTSSTMRTNWLPELKDHWLPSELTNVIVPVNKLTSEGNKSTTIVTSSDDLFLLSEIEIFGSTFYSVAGEGTQYAYYAAGNSPIKELYGSADFWWERSPCDSNGTNFCSVTPGGTPAYIYASDSYQVFFAFCV